jgi:predicted DNA-binding transcriptional regulator AlpA
MTEPTPLLITDTEAARLAGIGRSTWHRLRAAGLIGPEVVRLGRCCRYRRDEVVSWIAGGCPPRIMWTARREQERRLTLRRS